MRNWVRQAERDAGPRAGLTSDERARLKVLERECRELRQANEILRKASTYFAQAELDRRFKVQTMIAFIDDHREAHGVEPIYKVLPIAPSTYRAHAATRRDPEKSSARAKRDTLLREKSAASSTTISRSTACARFGGSCCGREKTWRVAPSRG